MIEESREIVVALDREGRVVAASRRAREALPELAVGRLLPESTLRAVEVPYDVNGTRETLVYLSEPAEQRRVRRAPRPGSRPPCRTSSARRSRA